MDTGASCTVWPKKGHRANPDPVPRLTAANGTSIRTYGRKEISLKFSGISFKAKVTLADVRAPMLGWDWFADQEADLVKGQNGGYHLRAGHQRVKITTRRPRDGAGKLAAAGTFQHFSQQQTILAGQQEKLEPPPARYAKILAEFPGIDKPNFKKKPRATHTIDTGNETPCRASVRRISPGTEKYNKGKAAWDELEELGVIKRLADN